MNYDSPPPSWYEPPDLIEDDEPVNYLCVRCEQSYPTARLVTIVNAYHNGPPLIYICKDCLVLGDRVASPEDDEDGDWEFGPDSATQALERGPA